MADSVESPSNGSPAVPEAPAPPADAAEVKKSLDALQRVVVFMEQTRLADYMDLMNRPWRLIWLNFIAGLVRGVAMAIGGSIVFFIAGYFAVHILKSMVHHVGGLPWIGNQAQDLITWILHVVETNKGKK